MKTIELKEKCVFLHITLSRLGDKRGISSDDIEVDADKSFVQARKIIFKSGAFDAIKSLDSKIRRYVRSQCFPYEEGLHLVPLKMVDEITAQLVDFKIERLRLIDVFAELYPTLADLMPEKLRKLHNRKDYQLEDIAGQFSMSWQFLLIEPPLNLDKISNHMFKEERDKLAIRMDEAFEQARMILRETCLALVTHLRYSLQPDQFGGTKRLSTSTVENLQKFLLNFNLRDITNDRELEQIVDEASGLLSGIDAESLRTMDGLRGRIHGELAVIEQKISEAVSIQPVRRIRA